MKFSSKFLVLTAILMLVAAPAMADDHLNETDTDSDDLPEDDSDIEEEEDENETEDEDSEEAEEAEEDESEEAESDDDSETDGTDNSTEMTVSEDEAERTARAALSDNNWTLEESKVDEEDGYYEFEFVVSGEEAEAEVRVDGSSGEVFRLEEELEQEEDSDSESNERAVQARIEAKQEQIERYRERISELQEEIQQLREDGAVEEQEERDREVEREMRRDGEDTEVEIEAEDGDREVEVEAETEGPDQNARENVNGTPGSEESQERRPGFVSRMLSGFFN